MAARTCIRAALRQSRVQGPASPSWAATDLGQSALRQSRVQSLASSSWAWLPARCRVRHTRFYHEEAGRFSRRARRMIRALRAGRGRFHAKHRIFFCSLKRIIRSPAPTIGQAFQAACTCTTVIASPATVVRRISRTRVSSNRVTRCMIWRLSHITRSHCRHLCE